MSIIAMCRKDNYACVAADTMTTFGELQQHSDYEKNGDKILFDGKNYIGIVGSAAHELVMRSILHKTEYDFSSREGIFESLRKMHPILKEKYFLNPKEENEDPYESTRIDALIINRKGIFAIFSLREVFEYSKFWAIGSGGDFALGAMFSLYGRDDLDATAIAQNGVKAGTEFNNASDLPMTSYTIELEC